MKECPLVYMIVMFDPNSKEYKTTDIYKTEDLAKKRILEVCTDARYFWHIRAKSVLEE